MTLLIIIALFITIFIGVWTLSSVFMNRNRPANRLEDWMSESAGISMADERRQSFSWIQHMGGVLEGTGFGRSITERTRWELVRADIPFTGYEFNVARGTFSIALALLAYSLTRNFLWVFIMAIAVWTVPMLIVKRKKAKRYQVFASQMGDALGILSNSLRAGFSFMQAVSAVARETPNPMGKEFGRLTKEMSMGITTEKALDNLVHRVQQEDLELLVTAILIQKEIGGNLAEILDNIGNTIRERIRIKSEVKTLTAQGKLSGIVIAGIPVFLGLALYGMNRDYILLLFTHPVGKLMLGLALFNEFIGVLMIRKIVSIDV